jgi:AcrR family transcriptional regulator
VPGRTTTTSKTAKRPPTPKAPRAALSERAITEAALEVLAEQGVEGLTMRELSARLNVALGATYRHVRSKHQLLLLVTEELYSRVKPGNPRSNGFNRAKAVMLQIHDLLGAYPGLSGYMASHLGDFESASVTKLLTDPLRDAGLSELNARKTGLALTVYTAGQLVVRDSLPDGNGTSQRDLFVDGLDLILDGARTRVRKTAARRAT